ncbi:UNVERIFIED_CONTAM: putative metallophosphoesterase [Sesamum calycinum]|uniref:Metallophosphoesterase n=1 Tax=Sesamum calycinum TaxID=2727403 RepID=A0AAW2J997_9LAMI
MGNLIGITILLLLLIAIPFPPSSSSSSATSSSGNSSKRELIEVGGGPDDLVWVVQLSDLHFSVHHPERAREFQEIVGFALSFIKPSLVLLTGDLTGFILIENFCFSVSSDGKSKDLLIMKQDEDEWIEYQKVMQDVVQRSGLDRSAFYDIRGNHDNLVYL